jgi:serine phosphatase RsbU (regulator of sigma subunit)
MQHSSENLIEGLDPHTLATLKAIGRVRSYPAGTSLTMQGKAEGTYYVIESGRAVVLRTLESGEERVLNTLGPSQTFGEMALLDDSPRLATVKALTEVSVLEITADQFRLLIQTDPDLALHITRRVLANLRRLDTLAIEDLRNKNALLQEAYTNLQLAQAELVEKERLEREMELAAEMQRSLLPEQFPEYEDYRFSSYLAPARHVGGDLFDVRELDEEQVGILIADVADKGMYAAFLMAVTRTLFYQEALRSLSPKEVAYAVHRGLLAIGGVGGSYGMDAFVTAFYGVLHRPSGELCYVRAAQDRPLLLRPGEVPVAVGGDGRFLGMLEALTLEEHSIHLSPGDCLLLYSDGVTDALNDHDERFGLQRLKQSLLNAAGRETNAPILDSIISDVEQWRGHAPAFDDITMLLVEVLERPKNHSY